MHFIQIIKTILFVLYNKFRIRIQKGFECQAFLKSFFKSVFVINWRDNDGKKSSWFTLSFKLLMFLWTSALEILIFFNIQILSSIRYVEILQFKLGKKNFDSVWKKNRLTSCHSLILRAIWSGYFGSHTLILDMCLKYKYSIIIIFF